MNAIVSHWSDCSMARAWLGPYIDGELQETKRQQVEAHIGSCRSCSGELERLRTIRERVRHGLAVSLPNKDARRFWGDVEQRIQAVKARPLWTLDQVRELFWFYPKLKWASAAVLGTTILLFAADLLLRPMLPPPTPLGPTDAAPKTVVESVEGGPNSSVVLFSTPDQQLKIIWVLERERS